VGLERAAGVEPGIVLALELRSGPKNGGGIARMSVGGQRINVDRRLGKQPGDILREDTRSRNDILLGEQFPGERREI